MLLMEIHLRTTGCRLPYEITLYLPASRHKRTHPVFDPSQWLSEGWCL